MQHSLEPTISPAKSARLILRVRAIDVYEHALRMMMQSFIDSLKVNLTMEGRLVDALNLLKVGVL